MLFEKIQRIHFHVDIANKSKANKREKLKTNGEYIQEKKKMMREINVIFKLEYL